MVCSVAIGRGKCCLLPNPPSRYSKVSLAYTHHTVAARETSNTGRAVSMVCGGEVVGGVTTKWMRQGVES